MRTPDHDRGVGFGVFGVAVVVAIFLIALRYLPSGQWKPYDSRGGFVLLVVGVVACAVISVWFYWPTDRQ